MSHERSRPAYQTPPFDLAEEIWEQRRIEPWALLKIVAWKSANGNLGLLSQNSEPEIEAVTLRAISALLPYRESEARVLRNSSSDWIRFLTATDAAVRFNGGLASLHGIQLPTASAILAILNPRAWPVLDRWAVRSVFHPIPSAIQLTWRSTYHQYIERLVILQEQLYPTLTIHEVDQLAMNLARDKQKVPFDRIPLT